MKCARCWLNYTGWANENVPFPIGCSLLELEQILVLILRHMSCTVDRVGAGLFL